MHRRRLGPAQIGDEHYEYCSEKPFHADHAPMQLWTESTVTSATGGEEQHLSLSDDVDANLASSSLLSLVEYHF